MRFRDLYFLSYHHHYYKWKHSFLNNKIGVFEIEIDGSRNSIEKTLKMEIVK